MSLWSLRRVTPVSSYFVFLQPQKSFERSSAGGFTVSSHENTHVFMSDNNGAGVWDRITQERNVALTVQVISPRAEADERLTSAVIKRDGSDGDGHPKVTWLPASHITLVRNQEISHLKNSHASSVLSDPCMDELTAVQASLPRSSDSYFPAV